MRVDEESLLDPAEGSAPPPPPPEDKPSKVEETPSEKELRRSNAELRRALRDTTEALKSVSRRDTAPVKPAEEEAAPTLSVDLVEAITNNDSKAIAKAMREMGFVHQRDVDDKITSTRGQIAKDKELYDEFPELEDSKSEFFKLTSKIYNDLAKDPSLKASGRLAEIAAKMADRELGGSEPAPRRRAPARVEEDDDFGLERDLDDDNDDRERERVDRVRRQSGDRGRRSSRSEDRGSNDLDATQKTIVAKLKAAGADISEEGYRKRAEKGVRMAGLPTRRPR